MAALAVGERGEALAHLERAFADHDPGIVLGSSLRSPGLAELAEPLLVAHRVLRDAAGRPLRRGAGEVR
jgi:hypothetical protein